MKLYSTQRKSEDVNFEEAVFKGLPPDNGLYLPSVLPLLPLDFWHSLESKSFQEMAFLYANELLKDEIPENILKEIVYETLSFEIPIIETEENMYVMELFQGPSLAFKDFGARFMARIMSYFLSISKKEINILVATSGDTGGAVAMGFFNSPGIKVTILYPSGKVSNLQEKQLTTLGANIHALEVNGTFDDCQKLVKEAFLDAELNSKMNLSSANSINIARLIPQAFYYLYAYSILKSENIPLVFSVPSGNFGNIGAGLIAKKMGLPIDKFIASTNANNIVPQYLKTGIFNPRPSVRTISNAMDVGNPSNFARIHDLYSGNLEEVRKDVVGYWFDDIQTEKAMQDVYEKVDYLMCPHTAVAYLGLKKYQEECKEKSTGVFLGTAHPAKFMHEMPSNLSNKVIIPDSLANIALKPKTSTKINAEFADLKNYLFKN